MVGGVCGVGWVVGCFLVGMVDEYGCVMRWLSVLFEAC